jgi:hypothetical protein
LAFSYRKRSPGSCVARTGAGRRPDIPKELRYEIGQYCELRYLYECEQHNLRLWFDQLIEVWQAINHSWPYRIDFYYRLFENDYLTNEDIIFAHNFTYYPLSLYDNSNRINFDITLRLPVLLIISNKVFGFDVHPQTEKNLPRQRIARTRKRIILEAQSILSDPNQKALKAIRSPLLVSIRFIKSCWTNYSS